MKIVIGWDVTAPDAAAFVRRRGEGLVSRKAAVLTPEADHRENGSCAAIAAAEESAEGI
jgi:hypothetical protein